MFGCLMTQLCIKDKTKDKDRVCARVYSNFGVFYQSKLLKHDGVFPCGFFWSSSGNIICLEV